MDTWLVIFILGNLGFFGMMVGLAIFYRLQKDRQRSEERMRVLERFSSAEELDLFLSSPSGRRLFDRFAPPPTDPRRAILFTLSAGLIILLIGGGMMLAVNLAGFGDLPGNDPSDELTVSGTILLCAGVGIVVAGALSAALSRRWGMIQERDDNE